MTIEQQAIDKVVKQLCLFHKACIVLAYYSKQKNGDLAREFLLNHNPNIME